MIRKTNCQEQKKGWGHVWSKKDFSRVDCPTNIAMHLRTDEDDDDEDDGDDDDCSNCRLFRLYQQTTNRLISSWEKEEEGEKEKRF